MSISEITKTIEYKLRANEPLKNIYIDNIMGQKNCIALNDEIININNIFETVRDIGQESKIVIFLDDEICNITSALFNFGDILDDCIVVGFLSPHLLLKMLRNEPVEMFEKLVFVLDYNLKTTMNGVEVLREICDIFNNNSPSFPAIIWTGNGPDVTNSEEHKSFINKIGVKVLDKLFGYDLLLEELQKHNIKTLF